MRMSQLFGKTLRKVEARGSEGMVLLVRAGFLRREPHAWLPLGARMLQKCRELWDACLSQSAQQMMVRPRPKEAVEKAVMNIAGKEIASYRDLPAFLEVETRPGSKTLFHLEEDTTAILCFGFHSDPEEMEDYITEAVKGVSRFLEACGLEAPAPQESDGWDWIIPLEGGPSRLVRCPECGYEAPVRWAKIRKEPLPPEEPRPIEEVATPGCTTIEAVANFVGVPKNKTAKAVFYSDENGQVVFVVIRGDLDVNETRLACALGWVPLKPATEAELFMAGIVAGYASPVGISGRGLRAIVADDSLLTGANFVAGANKEGYHLLNVNYPRDFKADAEADIALARPGDPCPRCGAPLEGGCGIVIASLRRARPNLTYNTPEKTRAPICVSVLALYPEHLAEAVAQLHHDERGLMWPRALAPYQVHLIGLGEEGLRAAEELYQKLTARGCEVLFDDRDESPGVKFTDADLIGLPIRAVIGKRSLAQGGVEVKERREKESKITEMDSFIAHIAPGS